MPCDLAIDKVRCSSFPTSFRNSLKCLTHQTIYPRKRKPFFAQVFDGGSDVVELFFIDDEEAVVDVWHSMNVDSRVLRVVFIEVEAE